MPRGYRVHLLSTARKLRLLLLAALATVSLAMGFAPPAQDAAVAPAQAAALKQIVASGRVPDMRWPDFSDYKVLVDGFYAPAGYAPGWTKGGQPSAAALALIQAFRDAGKRGLEPEDYDASKWDARLQALKGPNANLASFDAALTVCAMRLVSDLHIGRINPQHFHFGLSVQGKKYDLPRMLREQVMTAADVSAVLDGVEPPFGGYRRTKAALARYVELARGPAVEPARRRSASAWSCLATLSPMRRRPPTATSTAVRWSKGSNASRGAMASTRTASSDQAPSSS